VIVVKFQRDVSLSFVIVTCALGLKLKWGKSNIRTVDETVAAPQ